jgi:ABC-type sulfate transport system permease subunit
MTMQIAHSGPVTSSDGKTRAREALARDNLRTEPKAVRIAIIMLAIAFLTIFVVLPLVVVFAHAFSKGIAAYLAALAEPEAPSEIAASSSCVPCSCIKGISARATNGKVTKVVASTMPGTANRIWMS